MHVYACVSVAIAGQIRHQRWARANSASLSRQEEAALEARLAATHGAWAQAAPATDLFNNTSTPCLSSYIEVQVRLLPSARAWCTLSSRYTWWREQMHKIQRALQCQMSMARLPTLQDLLEEQMAWLQQANMSASAAALEAQLSSLAALLSSLQELLDTLLSCQALWQRNVLAVSAADAGRHLLPRASVAQVLCRASLRSRGHVRIQRGSLHHVYMHLEPRSCLK